MKELTSPAARQALERLMEGNAREVKGKLEHPHQDVECRRKLASGQHPFCTILTCADSRTCPEVIFDQGLGDIFVLRVAGNVLDDMLLGSIEFASDHLKTPLVMVLGHSQCGAIKAVHGLAPGESLPGHLPSIKPPIQAALKEAESMEGDTVNNAARVLARNVASEIEASTPVMSRLVAEDAVNVVAAYYDLESGQVDVLA
jgi:carbonic anhydrase